MKNEVRPIGANALAEKIREYMGDFPNATARLAACRAILSMLGDEQQTPTLNHPGRTHEMVPLTLEQLREMDGQPVWLSVAGGVWGLVNVFDNCAVLSTGGGHKAAFTIWLRFLVPSGGILVRTGEDGKRA